MIGPGQLTCKSLALHDAIQKWDLLRYNETAVCCIDIVFPSLQEWDLFKHVETAKMSVVHGYSSTTKSYPTFSCISRAARRPGYFYWNIFLVLFFINSLR